MLHKTWFYFKILSEISPENYLSRQKLLNDKEKAENLAKE